MAKFFRKLLLDLGILFHAFFRGLRDADAMAFEGKTEKAKDGISNEEHEEKQNVYKDLLRGEVTQAVKELRHEMYYSERGSYGYQYSGNGNSYKLEKPKPYTGNYENSDNGELILVQDNRPLLESLSEMGAVSVGRNTSISGALRDAPTAVKKKAFEISIERDFLPQFRIEEYVTRLFVKRIDGDCVHLDFYLSMYPKQFDRRHRLFIGEMQHIAEGDTRSYILKFDKVRVIANNAWGVDNMREFEFMEPRFLKILLYDGCYILRYAAKMTKCGEDLIAKYYDETADGKNKRHEARDERKVTVDMTTIIQKAHDDSYDAAEALRMFETVKKERSEMDGND